MKIRKRGQTRDRVDIDLPDDGIVFNRSIQSGTCEGQDHLKKPFRVEIVLNKRHGTDV